MVEAAVNALRERAESGEPLFDGREANEDYDPSPQQIIEDQRRDVAAAAKEIGTDPAKLSDYLSLPLGLVEQRLAEIRRGS